MATRRKLRVYHGNLDGRRGGIVAATSLKAVAEVLNAGGFRGSLYEVRQYWTETGNEGQIALAMSRPGTLFVGSLLADADSYRAIEATATSRAIERLG